MALIYQLDHGLPVDPAWVLEYGIDETPCVLVVDPLDGTTASSGSILAGRRVNSCDPAQVEAMRFAAFSTIPVKEVSVVGPDAETLCTDLGRKLFSEPTIVKDVRNIFANSPIKFSQRRAGSHGA